MSSLQILKSRIKSINVILKATNAVKTMTNIKLSKLRNNIKNFNKKFDDSLEIIHSFAKYIKQENINESFLTKDNTDNKIAILIFSDKGLCGGYNSQLHKFFMQHLQTQKETPKFYNKIIIIGNKGKKYMKQYNVANEIFNFSIAKFNSIEILNLCKNLTICDIFCNQYKTILEQKPRFFSIFNHILKNSEQESILQLNNSQINENFINLKNKQNQINHNLITVEYNALYELQQDILENYLINKLSNLIVNAKLSEECARLVMMDSSIKNAEDLSINLTLQMNKKRQNNITNQIMEINASIID